MGNRQHRLRHSINETRTRNKLPEIRYNDLGYAMLQYMYGSHSTTGLARYRNVYRMKSVNNR